MHRRATTFQRGSIWNTSSSQVWCRPRRQIQKCACVVWGKRGTEEIREIRKADKERGWEETKIALSWTMSCQVCSLSSVWKSLRSCFCKRGTTTVLAADLTKQATTLRVWVWVSRHDVTVLTRIRTKSTFTSHGHSMLRSHFAERVRSIERPCTSNRRFEHGHVFMYYLFLCFCPRRHKVKIDCGSHCGD